MKIPHYTYLAFQLNRALDKGIKLDMDDTKSSLQDNELFEYLAQNIPFLIDISLYTEIEKNTLIIQLRDLSDTYIDHKFGVESNGITMLIAYLLELIQRHPSDS